MRLPGMLALALLAGVAHGRADAPTEELLAKMRTAYASINSAKLSVTCRFFHGRRSLEVPSEVEFVRPMFVRMETRGVPGLTKPTLLTLTDGKQLFVDGLPPEGPLTQPYDFNKFSRQLDQFNLEVLCLWDSKRQFSTAPKGNMFRSTFKTKSEKWNGRSWTVLEETAGPANTFVRYFIDPKTYLIHRTTTATIGQKPLRQETWITKLEINPKIDASRFKIPKS